MATRSFSERVSLHLARVTSLKAPGGTGAWEAGLQSPHEPYLLKRVESADVVFLSIDS